TTFRVGESAGNEKSDLEQEQFQQTVQVLDTATGNSVLSVKAEPAVLAGHNFSLSPDGRLLAVVTGTRVELYALREMSDDERKKYIVVKSDTPDLHAPPAQPNRPEVAQDYVSSGAQDEAANQEPAKVPSNSTTNENDLAKRPVEGTASGADVAKSALPP